MATTVREDFIATAAKLGDFAAEYDDQADRERRLSPLVVEEMFRSGLTRLVRSKRLGGHEVPVSDYVEVLREVSSHSGSAGWVLQVMTIHEWFMSYTHPELQADVYGADPEAVVVDAVPPVGDAKPAAGGFELSGRWRFVSGVEWSTWAAVGAVAVLPDGPGTPEPCLFFVPRREFSIVDEWDTLGLRGTASNTVVVDSVFVPTHRVFPVGRVAATGEPVAERLDDGPLFHVPWGPMLCASIFPASIGIAQHALAEFRNWTEQRVRPYEAGAAQRENPYTQILLAESATRLDAVQALATRYAAELDRRGSDRRTVLTPEERARLFAWRGYISQTSSEIVDRLFRESGGNAQFATHPLHRLFRDSHAAASHASLLTGDSMLSYARAMFGGPGHPMF